MYRWFTIVFLVLILSIPSISLARIYPGHRSIELLLDDSEFGGYIDGEYLSITDNSTHLLIELVLGDDLPDSNPSMEFLVWFDVFLDIDNYFMSGSKYYKTYGADIEFIVNFTSTEVDGYVYGYTGLSPYDEWPAIPDSWLDFSGSTLSLYIPLDELPNYVDYIDGDVSHIRVVSGYTWTTINDHFISEDYRVLVDLSMYTRDIIVDGDPSDWLGLDPVIIDMGDDIDNYYDEINATAIYTALSSDGETLYHLINLSSIYNPDDYASYPDYDLWPYDFMVIVYYDLDNDGVDDVTGVYTDKVAYIVYPDNWAYLLFSYDVYFNGMWIELGISTSELGISSNLISLGSTFSWEFMDYIPRDRDIMLYSIGVGGHTSHFIEPIDTNLRVPDYGYESRIHRRDNPHLFYYNGFSVLFNVTRYNRLIIRVFDNEMSGVSSVDAALPFYVLWFYHPDRVVWPIEINITYDESILADEGIDEDELAPYFFNRLEGVYETFSSYSVDTSANVVYITMHEEEYLAGDGIIVLGRLEVVEEYTFQGISSMGITTLSLDIEEGVGELVVFNPLLNSVDRYAIHFSVDSDTLNSLILSGYIVMVVNDREVTIPIVIIIDKLEGRAFIVGPLYFIPFSG